MHEGPCLYFWYAKQSPLQFKKLCLSASTVESCSIENEKGKQLKTTKIYQFVNIDSFFKHPLRLLFNLSNQTMNLHNFCTQKHILPLEVQP